MTSTTDMAGHPDVEELSDLSEGLLSPSRTADVRRHLEDCPLCADVYHSLEEIRGLLGTLPGPPRMPDDVANRIDAALAAEALLSSTAPAAAPGTADADSREVTAAHVSRETGTSSAADRPSGRARAATGPGRARRARLGRRRTVALAAVFAAAAVGVSALLVQALGGDTGKSPIAAPQHTDAAHTYSQGTLQSQVARLLAGKTDGGRSGTDKPWGAQSEPSTTGSSGMRPNKTFQDTTVNVPSCIQQAITTNESILAADKGVYQGSLVYLLVTPDASDTTKVTAYIVDAACVKQRPPSPGKVLLTHSYARS
ncbi:anti-sigma factor family protein [Streptomyces sp. NPDC001848]|uniref:anti-sigma factor family protein n=1 Tax=Streptomyces sp. NPDC001848 TaxID=3364618 RepID=UPI0036D0B9B7